MLRALSQFPRDSAERLMPIETRHLKETVLGKRSTTPSDMDIRFLRALASDSLGRERRRIKDGETLMIMDRD